MAIDKNLQLIISLKDNATKGFKSIGKSIENNQEAIRNTGLAFGAMGGAITYASKQMLNTASDAEETQSKFNTVFSGIEKQVNQWSVNFANDIGRANQDIKMFTSGLADVLKPMGLQTKQAAEMSKKMVKLGLDVASFNNRQDADVIKAFTSALTGERESLKTLGIVINEADVKTEAYNAGLAKQGEELSKTAKAQATMNLLFKNTKDAQGDLERTSESYANQEKAMQATLKNTSEIIGKELIPIGLELLQALNKVIDKVVTFSNENPKLFSTIVKVTAVIGGLLLVLSPLLITLPGIISAVGMLAGGVSVLAGAFAALNAPILLIIGTIGALIAIGYKVYKNWDTVKVKLKSVVDSIRGAFESAFSSITDAINNPLNAIKNLISYAGRAISKVKSIGSGAINSAKSFLGFSEGGIVPKYFASGGVVPQYFASGGLSKGTDTVPAMLTPGELILNQAQQSNVASGLGGNNITITGNSFYGTPKRMAEQVFELLQNKLKSNLKYVS